MDAYGLQPCLRGSVACRVHHCEAARNVTKSLCPAGHELKRRRCMDPVRCSLCDTNLVLGDVLWNCALGCSWPLWHACATQVAADTVGMGSAETPPPAVCGQVEDMHLDMQSGFGNVHMTARICVLQPDENPCGLVKGSPDTRDFCEALRRQHYYGLSGMRSGCYVVAGTNLSSRCSAC